MAVQFRVIDRRRKPQDILRSFEQSADALKKRVLEKAADALVKHSPVDTGTYILSHDIAEGGRASGLGSVSSRGKPRNQSKGAFEGAARAKLATAIEALSPGFRDVYMRNTAAHAARVEYIGWEDIGVTGPYHVYGQTRAQMAQFITEAKAELGFE